MSNVLKLLEILKKDQECKIYPPDGIPVIKAGLKMPDDLRDFYEICGGVELFPEKEYGFTILSPKDITLANPIIIGELCEEDISSTWYVLCKDRNENYITIDMDKKRLGRCYDSFWDRHGVVGECPIVAMSFTELLMSLLTQKGEKLFWLEKDFEYLGDAYD